MLRRTMIAAAPSGPVEYAKWDAAFKSSLIALSDSDLSASRMGTGRANGAPYAGVRATVGRSTGKWYFEISSNLPNYTGNAGESAGICSAALDLVNVSTTDSYIGLKPISYGHCYRRYGGGSSGVQEIRSGSSTFVTGGTVNGSSGVIGIAVDLDAGRAWCVINGAWTFGASPTSTPVGRFTFTPGTTMYPAITIQDGITTVTAAIHKLNAGQAAFLNVTDAAFNSGGVLAGFSKGWWR